VADVWAFGEAAFVGGHGAHPADAVLGFALCGVFRFAGVFAVALFFYFAAGGHGVM
jgi:hypothetical protein